MSFTRSTMAQTIRRHIGAVDSVSVSVHLDRSWSDTCADRCGIDHLQQVGGLFDIERSEQEVTDDQDALP